MASVISNGDSFWMGAAGQLIKHMQYDDLIAMSAVLFGSVAYVTNGVLWNRPDPYQYQLYEKPQQRQTGSVVPRQSRCISERLRDAKADVAILWGSQSGTAERFAGRLAKDLSTMFTAKVLLLDISDIEPTSFAKLQSTNLAIFIASTFGEGDPSDNMHEVWEWLNQTDGVSLENMRFIAFGLGNSNYKHYNHVIDVLAEQLEARGGQSLMKVGKADDATGATEEDFLEWKQSVFDLFEISLGYRARDWSYEPAVEIIEDGTMNLPRVPGHLEHSRTPQGIQNSSKIFTLPIHESRELFRDSSERNCVHLELDSSQQPELKYKTGDYLLVWPVNPTSEVECLLGVLGLVDKRDTSIHIKAVDGTNVKVPSPTSFSTLFRCLLETCALVSRDYVRIIASFAPTKQARDFLTAISDKATYADFVGQNYINLGRLLEAACSEPGAWKGLPLSLVFEILPAMQPRSYSISSSSVHQAKRIAITAVVSDRILPVSGHRIPGLATNYILQAATGRHLHGLEYGSRSISQTHSKPTLDISIRKSAFKLPTIPSAPIVMVGAGTGVAPFRAFIQERARLAEIGRQVGTTKLFFGCRNPSQDFIYEDEFAGFVSKLGDCFSIITAFSRPTDGSRKKYVQDVLVEEPVKMLELLVEQNAHLYICGSAAMARDVSNAVSQMIMASKGWTEVQMKAFADRQKRTQRWLQDVWG